MKKFKFKITNKGRNALTGYAFISLWIIGYLIFTLWPMFYSLFLSFNKVKVTPKGIKTDFVGLANYKQAFLSDPQFIEKLIGYLKNIVLSVPIIIVFALIIAILINQDIKGRSIFRTIFFLPVIITSGPVIGELMAQGATSIPSIEQNGIFNLIQGNLGPVFAEPITYLFKEIIMVLWFSGVQILIFLAGLQKIDAAVYEAARIDGASSWEVFWKVTLPALKPLIMVNVIYTLVSQSTFALNPIIDLIKTNMFSTITGFGYATAISWVYFVVIVILLLLSMLVLNLRKN